jgi:NYN domain
VDRCALFVDAGYVLADGAMAVHGTRQRDSVSWDYAGLVKLLTGLSRDRTGLPVLRCYWYEATVEGRRSSEHNTLADLPGVKLRLGRMRPGRREGVEAEMHRDLTTLARNRAVSDAVIVSAEEDLAEVVAEVQELGLRVVIVHITADGNWTASRPLRQECDDIVEISGAHLRPFVDLIPGAEPAGQDDQYRNGSYAPRSHERRSLANGHGAGLGAVTHQGLPAAALPAPPGIYTTPVVEEYQRTAQPSGPGRGQESPASSAASPPAAHAAPQAAAPAPAPPPVPPLPDQAAAQAPAGSRDPAGSPAPDARAQGGQHAPPAGQAPAGHQAPGAHQAPAGRQAQGAERAAQFPAAQGPDASQILAAPTSSGGYGAQPGDHVPAHGGYGPAPGQARADLGQNASGPPPEAAPSHGRRRSSAPQSSPVQGGPPAPVRQAPVPQHEAMPQQNTVPQNAVPQDLAPRNPVSHDPVRQAPGPSAAMPPPGPAEARFGPVQGDYGPPGQDGLRALPARDAMPAPGPEAVRPAGPPAQFADEAAPGRFAEGQVPGRLAEGAGPDRFRDGAGPAQYSPAPPAPPAPPAYSAPAAEPGAFGAGGPGQAPYPQFPGAQPGQHAAPVQEPGYPVPQHEQGPYGAPQPAAHANLPQPVSQSLAVSLTDAIQAAHAEGFGFGDAVARDAPALWLEAVLARKPRMPSDLEARLLQGSALPIDSLLHDEVRHSLRRGFWDALERSRR